MVTQEPPTNLLQSIQQKHTFPKSECFSVSFDPKKDMFAAAFSDGFVRVWNLQQLINSQNGLASTTLDKPSWLIANSASLGAPIQVRISGDLVAVNSIDYSVRVYRLLANGNSKLVSQISGEQAQAWRFEFFNQGQNLITSLFSLKQFGTEDG